MLPSIFQKAAEVIAILKQNQFEGYIVGGCVRDYIIDRPINDVDIATSATPAEVQRLFPQVIPVGMEHGTVIVRHQHTSFEVTTYRTDGTYTDRRRPDQVEFVRDIKEDLKRRDFTMNAIAMDAEGNLLDLFNGREDISRQIIRTVGKAEKRFEEDALRIIRAVRFSSQLGFSIEKETKEAMKHCRASIESLAVERLTVELQKLFAGKYCDKAIGYLEELGLYQHLPVFDRAPELLRELKPVSSLAPVFAFISLRKPALSVQFSIQKYKCSNQVKKQAELLVNIYQLYEQNGIDAWLVYQLPQDLFPYFHYLVSLMDKKQIAADHWLAVQSALPIQSKKELAVDGNDLMYWFPGRKKGKWIKELLEEIEYQVVISKLDNDKPTIKDWIKWNQPEQN